MKLQDLINVSLVKEDAYYALGLCYDEFSFNTRLKSLYADELIEQVVDFINTFSLFPRADKVTLAMEFLRQLYDECEKYAERSLARRKGTNIFEIVSLNYEYAILQDLEYIEMLLVENFGRS